MSSLRRHIAQLLSSVSFTDSSDFRNNHPLGSAKRSSTPDSDDVDVVPDSRLEDHTPTQKTEQVIADLKSELKESRKSSGQQLSKIQQLSSTLREAQAELDYLGNSIRHERAHFSQERNALLTKLQKAQSNLDSAMTDLRKAQISTFKQAQSDWVPEDDSKVREDVAQIYKDIRTWAKAHADSGPSLAVRLSGLDQMQKDDLMSMVSHVASCSRIEDITNMKYPFLILAALLSEYLRHVIFGNPFFWLNYHPEMPSCYAFNQVFMEMCHARISDAHMWRALLMRFSFGNGVQEDVDEPVTSAMISKTYAEWLYGDFVQVFLGYEATCLLKKLEDKERQVRDQELRVLVIHAANLFGRLQTQRTSYQWTKASQALGMEFSASSPYLKADRLHKIDEDEDDVSMDGSKVKIVLSPVVLASGNSQGEDYENQRVIAKAVVFLEETDEVF